MGNSKSRKNKITIRTRVGYYYRSPRVLQGQTGQSITLKGTSENISQGAVTESYTSSFPLTEIDDLREYILRSYFVDNREIFFDTLAGFYSVGS